MKILLDANVAIDVLGATEDVLFSLQALDIMLLRGFQPCVSVSTLPTIHYALAARKLTTKRQALSGKENFSDLVTILDMTDVDFKNALAHPLKDFEDAMLAWSAQRHGADLIVTRNTRDFEGSPVAIMTPQQFCDAYRPPNYEYDLLELEG